jgi:hypothetical protein
VRAPVSRSSSAHIRGLVPASNVNWLAAHSDSPWRVLRCSGSNAARWMSPCGAKVRLTHRRGPARFAGGAGTSTARAMVWRSPPEAESCAARRAGGGLSRCSRGEQLTVASGTRGIVAPHLRFSSGRCVSARRRLCRHRRGELVALLVVVAVLREDSLTHQASRSGRGLKMRGSRSASRLIGA